ncbi:MAG: DUF6502 family protein [Methylococcales bacterium]|nr:DUF6502 family protein [Methylococcales bacterium]
MSSNTALIEAIQRLLRPLVRLLLAKQITYTYLISVLKPLFVDVAATEFQLEGKQQTDSRLSLLTGVHRKDIRRFLDEPKIDLTPPVNVSLGARLIARWNGESDYLDEQALPMPLPRLMQSDGSPSFEKLVCDESKDIRARAVLDEWLRLGLVEIDSNDVVHLCTGAFVPEQGLEEKLYYLGRNVRDHIESAVHNVLDEKPPFLERSVYSDGLSPQAIEELAQLAESMSMDVLRAINKKAQELKKTSSGNQKNRITLGVYFYTDAKLEGKKS